MIRLLPALAFVAALTGCGGGAPNGGAAATTGPLVGTGGLAASSGSSNEPQTTAALKAMAQEQADRYSSGDYGGAWDMWSKKSKAVISRSDYVKLITACFKSGLPLKVSSARIDSPGKATVRLELGDIQRAYHPSYEDGHWVWNPTAEGLAQYSGGANEAINKLKASGDC